VFSEQFYCPARETKETKKIITNTSIPTPSRSTFFSNGSTARQPLP